MKKSELKKRILEALTPDEAAKVEPKYKETYAAMIKGKGPLKLKKYDNPDKVVRGRVVNNIKKESLKLAEKLGKDADLGDHIEDFQKSNAPQFQGKSKKKKNQMATAAFLNKEKQKLDEIDDIMEKEDKLPVNDIKKAIKALLKKEGGAAGLAPILKLSKDFDNVTQIDIEDILDNGMKDVEKHRDGDYILKEDAREQAAKMFQKMPKGKIIKTSKGEFKKVDTDKFEKIGKPGRTINSFAMSMIKEDAQDKSEENYSNYFKKMDKNRLEEFVKEALKNPKKADLNKDNKLSDYEKARATAIEKSIDKVDEDVVPGSNIRKDTSDGDYEVVSGKTGKPWPQNYKTKKSAKSALKGYFASKNESLSELILKELRK